MKCNGRRCGGFTTLEVLLCLLALSVAVSVCVKWYVFKNHQRSVLRQRQRLVPCAEAFSLWIKEQPNGNPCVGTWYAVRNASKAGRFDFVREQPSTYDFRMAIEKTARFCITPHGVQEEDVADPPSKRSEFLIVRFYAEEKTHILHTCFVPVTAKQFKPEALTPEPVERFMLTPKAEKSSKNEDK